MRGVRRRLRTSAALSIVTEVGTEEAVATTAGDGFASGARELPSHYSLRAKRLEIDVRYSGLERIWSAIDRAGEREFIARFERG